LDEKISWGSSPKRRKKKTDTFRLIFEMAAKDKKSYMNILDNNKGGNISGQATRMVTCAFCQGEGVDRFDFLSPLSKCQACLGKGQVEIKEPLKQCAYCEGTGVQPYGARPMCVVCEGKGVVNIREPNEICPDCAGSGRAGDDGIPCLTCKGKGAVAKKAFYKGK